MSEIAAIVLAAGKSTRMKSELPKVLHEVCGRPMLSFVLNACRLAGVDRMYVVVGHGKELVMDRYRGESDLTFVEQREQKGTGHAVLCCREALSDFSGPLLVIAGDMPLVRRESLAGLYESMQNSDDACTIATTLLDDPAGYGRIVRDAEGELVDIIEHADCTPEQREIREVNPSYYCFDAKSLFGALAKVAPAGPKEEYYLTAALRILRDDGKLISANLQVPSEDAMGINSRVDLALLGRVMQDRLQRAMLEDGVTIVDPDNTWIEAETTVGRDTVIQPFTFIGAGATIGEGCQLGPFARIAAGESVPASAVVGPMSALSIGAMA